MDYREFFEANSGAVFRVQFKDGDVFVLRQVQDVSDAAGRQDTWNGSIVAREGLSERRQKIHTVGAGLDFRLPDIESVDIVTDVPGSLVQP